MPKIQIELPLIGGLGNQLFILAFGVFIAKSMNAEVRLIQTSSYKGNETHGNKIASQLRIEGLPVRLQNQTPVHRFAHSFGRFLSKSSWLQGKPLFGKSYLSEETFLAMTEEGALRLPPGKYHVSGYFQDPKYFEEAQKLGYFLELESRSPSTWFQEQMVNLRGKRAVGIHVRRGDTLRLPDHGVLSADYYRRALLSLGDEDRSDLYLVFSDERLKLQEEFKDLSKIADLVFLSPPQDSNPIESIILMSHCSTLIISNSTYSWWGASLGDGSKKVISPKYWSPNQKTALPSPSSQSWEWLMPSWRKIDAP